jgi:hypothetical protein
MSVAESARGGFAAINGAIRRASSIRGPSPGRFRVRSRRLLPGSQPALRRDTGACAGFFSSPFLPGMGNSNSRWPSTLGLAFFAF